MASNRRRSSPRGTTERPGNGAANEKETQPTNPMPQLVQQQQGHSSDDNTGGDRSDNVAHMRALVQMKQQDENERKKMQEKHYKSRIGSIVLEALWRKSKYPDLTSFAGEEFRRVLARDLPDKTQEEISRDWKMIKTVANLSLRSRRSYVTQMMKGNFFGKSYYHKPAFLFSVRHLLLLTKLETDFLKLKTDTDVYRRYHFLLFDYGTDRSIQSLGNQKFHQDFAASQEAGKPELETSEIWEGEWQHFPQYPSYNPKDLAEQGRALDLVSWLIHTFARSVCCTTKNDVYHQMLQEHGMAFITIDDFAFIFVQAQNNLPKWTLQHSAIKRGDLRDVKERDFNKDEKKVME